MSMVFCLSAEKRDSGEKLNITSALSNIWMMLLILRDEKINEFQIPD
jgi:hypothetical protein